MIDKIMRKFGYVKKHKANERFYKETYKRYGTTSFVASYLDMQKAENGVVYLSEKERMELLKVISTKSCLLGRYWDEVMSVEEVLDEVRDE